MKNFLAKHKVLGYLLDFVVLISAPYFIFKMVGIVDDISTSFMLPIFLNVFFFLMFFYVNLRGYNRSFSFNFLEDWGKLFLCLNVVALLIQFGFGFYRRFYGQVTDSLLSINRGQAVAVVIIYLLLIVVSGIVIIVSEKHKK